MTSETELLPCPFCGGKPTLELGETDKLYAIICTEDPCRQSGLIYAFTSENKEKAIKAWNTRADKQPQASVDVEGIKESFNIFLAENSLFPINQDEKLFRDIFLDHLENQGYLNTPVQPEPIEGLEEALDYVLSEMDFYTKYKVTKKYVIRQAAKQCLALSKGNDND